MSDDKYPGDVEDIDVGPEAASAADKRRRTARVKHAHDLLDRAADRLDGDRFTLLDAALRDAPDEEALSGLEKAIGAFRARVHAEPPLEMDARVRMALEVMHRRANGLERPIPTPWKSVNAQLRGGFWPGLYTLTSGTGMGKTQWAIQCALCAARAFRDEHQALVAERQKQGLPAPEEGPARVAYVALELGNVDLIARLLGVMADEDGMTAEELGTRYPLKWSDLFFGRVKRALVEVTERYAAELAALPIDVETADAIGWSYLDLRTFAEKRKPRLLVLDYSQLVSAPADSPRRQELRETIGNVAKVARDLARKHGIAVIALCSTARSNYNVLRRGKDGEVPWKDDPGELVGLGKEAGELEYTADVVLAMVKEPRPDQDQPGPDTQRARKLWEDAATCGPDAYPVNFVVAKGRGFPNGFSGLIFDGGHFLTIDDEWGAGEMDEPPIQAASPPRKNGKRPPPGEGPK